MPLVANGAMLCLLLSYFAVSPASSRTVNVTRFPGSPASADVFSLPTCGHPNDCKEQSTCYDGSCCSCKCPNSKANYIVNKWACISKDDLNQLNSTRCAYSMRKPQEPLLALPLTEVMANKKLFIDLDDHRTLIPCNASVQVGRWEYRDAFGQWQVGPGNIFQVSGYTKHGAVADQRVLQYLEWSGKLDSKYAGMLIRFILTCEGQEQGCFLSKISGTHSYDTTAHQTAIPPPVIPTITNGPTTKIPTTKIPTTKIPTTKIPTTTDSSDKHDTNAYQKGKESKGSSVGDAAAIFGPIFGVLGLVCLIGLVCVVAARYRRMKRRGKDPDTNSAAALEEYKDPIYADINKMNFDNPAYCDPILDRRNLKSHLGPLPSVPGSEPAYQALNDMTRTNDYDNPPVGMKSTADYDNPPVTDGMETTLDYDNPPVNDGMENNGDYDNPPINGDIKNADEYDNPPVKNDYDEPRSDANQNESAEDTFF